MIDIKKMAANTKTDKTNQINTFNPDTDKVEAASAIKAIKVRHSDGASEPGAAELNLPVPATELVATFHQYKSARPSIKTLTDSGIVIAFSGFKFVTDNQEVIDYLDGQIAKKGLPGITKVDELLTSANQDPMQIIRDRHFKEFKALEARRKSEAAIGEAQDMGNSNPAGTANINPLSSNGVAR